VIQALVIVAGVAALVGVAGLVSSLVRLYGVVNQPEPPAHGGQQRQRDLEHDRRIAIVSLQKIANKQGARVEARRAKIEEKLAGIEERLEQSDAELEEAKAKNEAAAEAWREEHAFAFRRAIASSVAAALWLLLAYLALMGAVVVAVVNQLGKGS